MGARREITAAVSERYQSAGLVEKGRILDELCKITGWHRKHAIRTLAVRKTLAPSVSPDAPLRREPTYDAIIRDALAALWEASERICGKRLKVMIPSQHSIIQRLLKTLRIKAAHQLIAGKMGVAAHQPKPPFRQILIPLTGNISP